MTSQEMQAKLKAIFDVAREQQQWGGSEDEEGTLHPGFTDFDALQEQIEALIEEYTDRPGA